GTRYADWYFAGHAVLIDRSGRYFSEPDRQGDSLGWNSLLGLLCDRGQRSLNGVLINLPVDLLLGENQQALENQARQIRQRLLEINRRLGMEVPVYLVLSKADLLLGF